MLGATVAAVVAVAGIAGAISYGHMHDWASANGEPSWRALLFPLSVDGLLIAASVVLLADSRSGRSADWLAYLLAGLGAAVSVAANVAHDWTDPVAATAIAGWPPLALLGSYELLMRLLRRLRLPSERVAAVEPAVPATPEPTATDTPAPAKAPRAARPVKRQARTQTQTRRVSGPGSAGRDRAWAWWRAERDAGREPSGAEVARVAGVDASLGRRWRRDWLSQETSGGETSAAETTGESRTATQNDTDPALVDGTESETERAA